MTISGLFEGVPIASQLPTRWGALAVRGLEYDSRRVEPGFLFFAFPGSKTDGRKFAEDAVARGAAAIVSESPAPEGFSAPWIQVAHRREALSILSRRFYGAPDDLLQLTGVTGTNGKTTTVYCIDAMLRAAGRATCMVGTIEYRVAGDIRPAVNTTPESLDLMKLFAESRDRGASHATMEVSSHALALKRVHGMRFQTVVFTNLTRDHLDFHGDMDHYFEAKRLLFAGAGGPLPRTAVVNADDPYGAKITCSLETRRLTYGVREDADLKAVNIDAGFHGLRFEIRHAGGIQRIESRLAGLINVYNLLGAFGAGLSLGLSPQQAADGLAACPAVPGRFERVDEGQPFLVVVDYAHTDDALRNTIHVARALKPKRVITVFGCGGDRDRTKRPIMGEAAAELSDLVILTNDNPRTEDPLRILNDILVGVRRKDTRHLVEPDREKAIRKAIDEAAPGDIILLAGKGHETYQILPSGTIHFDDRETARAILRSYGYKPAESNG
jgi:UDP-N-acetylmuramoyl-L-alanyl-D-glutamate--2,6-diaminopimelate ligase